jgi:hypothetical protein
MPASLLPSDGFSADQTYKVGVGSGMASLCGAYLDNAPSQPVTKLKQTMLRSGAGNRPACGLPGMQAS